MRWGSGEYKESNERIRMRSKWSKGLKRVGVSKRWYHTEPFVSGLPPPSRLVPVSPETTLELGA